MGMDSNNSDTARYTYRNISPDFHISPSEIKRLCINCLRQTFSTLNRCYYLKRL